MAGFDESGRMKGYTGIDAQGLGGRVPTHTPTKIKTGMLGLAGRPADSWVNIDKDKEESDRRYRQQQNKGGACFISFMEDFYGNGEKNAAVRNYRDTFMTVRCKRGYYRLSEFFVPLMRKWRIVRWFFLVFGVIPGALAVKYQYKKRGFVFAPVLKFWLKVFSWFGQDTEFTRGNGETL